jgi:ABC-type multidrug transport system ATPase subunit
MLSAHSMEEAEALCDRLGIFVDGSLQCIGNPKEVHCSRDMLYEHLFQNKNVKWVCV